MDGFLWLDDGGLGLGSCVLELDNGCLLGLLELLLLVNASGNGLESSGIGFLGLLLWLL